MRMRRALLLAAVFALSTLDGVAEEKQIVDVKELAGSWRGWVTEVAGDEWATMNVNGRPCWRNCTVPALAGRLAVKWPARRARRWRIGHAAPRSAWGDTSIPGDRTHPGAAVDAAVGARRVLDQGAAVAARHGARLVPTKWNTL